MTVILRSILQSYVSIYLTTCQNISQSHDMHHHHMSWPLPEPARCIGEGGRAGWLATRKGPTPSHRSEARRISISELWINGWVVTGFFTVKPWETPRFHGKIDGFRVRFSQENQSIEEIVVEMGPGDFYWR